MLFLHHPLNLAAKHPVEKRGKNGGFHGSLYEPMA